MNNRHSPTLIAASLLTMAILACNMGATPPPVEGSTTHPAESAAPGENTGSACANPLQPTAVGATWNYQMTGAVSDTFTRTIIAADASSFTDQDIFTTGVTRSGKWNCDNGNLITLDPNAGASASVNTTLSSTEFQTTANSGVTLPATVNSGDTWTQTFTIEGKPSVNGVEVLSKNDTTLTCTAAARESVTVPAGTFDAMRVDCQVDMTITITMQGTEVPTQLNMSTTSWYATGVGWVKSITTAPDLNTTIELTSYTIP